MVYVIEKGVPIPPLTRGDSTIVGTVRGLKVGESFVAPRAQRNSIYAAAARYGIKVISRKEKKRPAHIRIWRIEPTTCGRCDFEESDGSLIRQCKSCRQADMKLGSPP